MAARRISAIVSMQLPDVSRDGSQTSAVPRQPHRQIWQLRIGESGFGIVQCLRQA
jgi:hypothetical protein